MANQNFIIKLTGLPYSATCEDVAVFLAGLDISGGRKNGVHFTKDDTGRPSGECYVELMCKEDQKKALLKNHEYMGERWLNVTDATLAAMEADIDRANRMKQELDDNGIYIVKIRGIPWSCTSDDLVKFFQDSQLKDDKFTSIHILKNNEGRLTGQAFVEFADLESLEMALNRDREHMGKRYLEITRSDEVSLKKMQEHAETAKKYRDPIVVCRGLPYSATEDSVYNFFDGIDIVNVQLLSDIDGNRPAGKCFVEFSSLDECDKAMKKTGEKIGARYIEVFQSERKFWYDRDLGDRVIPPRDQPPRTRLRPSPYAKPFTDHHDMGPPPRRGLMTGRVKHISHGRGVGYDGAGGYEEEGYPVQKYAGGGGAGAKAPQKHIVLVKGVPLDASMGDIIKFFTESNPPKNVEMKFGEAVVEFNTHADAMRAMLKDKTPLANVRVVLELQSKPEDYTGYDNAGSQGGGAPVHSEPYADPYGHNDTYSSVAPARGGGFRW